ncbi:hypothetical protein G6M26_25660 [Agrobacterium tumefaciens]|nr:hypothetical protein [Agrobacterium tumefaciens]
MHDVTRSFRSGCGSFGIVDANLKKLLANDIPVSINTVVTNLNLAGLPELTAYLIKLDVPFSAPMVKIHNAASTINLYPNILNYRLLKEYIIYKTQIVSKILSKISN